jgi:hypothetical protein
MRYAKGSLNLSFRDKHILHYVADSRCVTHSQLFEFARLEYYEYNRPVFNWRVRRLVDCGLMRKRSLPMLTGDALYSITRTGVQALERLGVYYLGANLDRDQGAHAFQVPHTLEINNIRLALLRTRKLQRWIPESFIRVLNMSPIYAYAKVYDGVARVALANGDIEFAVEYERTMKSRAKYEKIREAIESEKRVKAFLYLVPSHLLLHALNDVFWRTKQLVLLGLMDDFKQAQLSATVCCSSDRKEICLNDALSKLAFRKPYAAD